MAAYRRLLVLLACCVLLLAGCQPAPTLKIGFVAELSGRNAVLGVEGRNGAQMAVDEINARGGIAGKQIELLVRDDQGKEDELLAADRELIDSQVVALTGHMTSWESIAALELVQEQGVPLFSATSSTSALTGKSDLFFRMIPTNQSQSELLAEILYKQYNLCRAAVIYETDNAAFTQTYAEGFSQYFRTLGGEISIQTGYSSAASPDFAQLVRDLRSAGPADALLVVASSMETAMLAQQARMQDWPVQIATSNWAYTEDLLRNGGRALEGTLLTTQFNSQCREPAYLDFKDSYAKKFGHPPAFGAVFSYETIQVLARALEVTGGLRQGLAETLVKTGPIEGLCGPIEMDQFGDVQRNLYLMTVHSGVYEVLAAYPSKQ